MTEAMESQNRFSSRKLQIAKPVFVPSNAIGAARILGHLAKPRNPAAPIKAIMNWYCVLTDQPVAYGRRSRSQAIEAANTVMGQLEAAWEVSEWVTGYLLNSAPLPGKKPEMAANIVDFVKAKVAESASIEAAAETHWKPYAPVMHLLMAWRQEMFRAGFGMAFDRRNPEKLQRLDRVVELLTGECGWVPSTAQASTQHLAFIAFNVKQLPRNIRLFAVAD